MIIPDPTKSFGSDRIRIRNTANFVNNFFRYLQLIESYHVTGVGIRNIMLGSKIFDNAGNDGKLPNFFLILQAVELLTEFYWLKTNAGCCLPGTVLHTRVYLPGTVPTVLHKMV
jgi:hypothetical protein